MSCHVLRVESHTCQGSRSGLLLTAVSGSEAGKTHQGEEVTRSQTWHFKHEVHSPTADT